MTQVVPSDFDPLDPPDVLRLDAGAVSRINWQPRWCTQPLECIASRRGDVLDVVFAWNIKREPLEGARFRYRLEPAPDDERVLIARRIT